MEPRETLILAVPKEDASAKDSDLIKHIFSRPQAPVDLTDLFRTMHENLKDLRDN